MTMVGSFAQRRGDAEMPRAEEFGGSINVRRPSAAPRPFAKPHALGPEGVFEGELAARRSQIPC
jgi:hypothetical protein